MEDEIFEQAILYATSIWGRFAVDGKGKEFIRTVAKKYHELILRNVPPQPAAAKDA
jgi:hypothetical protein